MAEPTVHTDHKVTGSQEVLGTTKANRLQIVEEVVVGSETPSVVGLLVRDSSNILYISTGTASPANWTKVGTQT